MSSILRGEKNKIEFDYMLKPISMPRVDFNDDIHVVGQITNSAGYMRLTAEAYLAYASECDRCLEAICGDLTIAFERTVVDKGTLTDEQLEEDIDEYVVINNGKLDIDEQLSEAIVMEFPSKLLCSEDCAGLCSKCGKPLKYGDCGCPKKEIDPRLAVLADFFKE